MVIADYREKEGSLGSGGWSLGPKMSCRFQTPDSRLQTSPSLFHHIMLFRSVEACFSESFANDAIRVCRDIIEMVVMAKRHDSQNRSHRRKRPDADDRFRLAQHIRNLTDTLFEQSDGRIVIGRMIELRQAFDPSIWVGGIILNIIAKDFVVPDESFDIVVGIDGRRKNSDLFDSTGDASGADLIAGFERP